MNRILLTCLVIFLIATPSLAQQTPAAKIDRVIKQQMDADKIPGVDLIWSALQTFVRVPVAGVMAFAATGGMSPGAQLASAVLASGIALAANGGKMALRATVSASTATM